MSCEYCMGTGYHDCRCPSYIPPEATHYCSICNDGIYNGEEYIENTNGEYAHYECIDSIRSLLKFLDCDIKTWED